MTENTQPIENPEITIDLNPNNITPVSQDDKNIMVLTHILGLFFGIIPSLVVYLAFSESKWVKDNSREAVNFQISILIYFVVSLILTFIVIGAVGLLATVIGGTVLGIVAAIRCSKGENYKFPLIIRIIR